MDGTARLVSMVGQLVGEEYQQLRGVGVQVAELKDELAIMNAILRMHSETEEGAVDHFIREWVKQVLELAYDAEDCVHLYICRIRFRSGDYHFIVWSKRMLATLFSRRRLAREIEALRARAVGISERHARYGVSRPPPSLASVAAAPVTTSAYALRPGNDPHRFVGISKQAGFLAEKLKQAGHDMKLQVLSIVGFGGLGKTTLAMEACKLLEADFQRQAQVSVSQAFDGKKDLNGLLKRVLQQIVKPKEGTKKQGIEEENHLADIQTMDL